MLERALVIVKPDGVERGLLPEIIKRIENHGLKIIREKQQTMSLAEISLLYSRIKYKHPTLWDSQVKHLTSGESVFMIIEGEEAINELLALRGPLDNAPKGTIRGDFAEKQNRKELYTQGRVVKTIMHTSDDKKRAEFEISLFFK